MRISLVILVLLSFSCSFAQDGYGSYSIYEHNLSKGPPKDTTVFVVPPNEYWYRQQWHDSVYLFPQFSEARLVFANGFSPTTRLKMNYNTFLGLMEAIGERGDTSVLKQYEELKEVVINETVFVHEPGIGYLEVLGKDKVTLASHNMMRVVYENSAGRKSDGFTADTDRSLRARITRYYWPSERYWFILEDGKVVRVSSLVLPQAYPELKQKIKTFVKTNKIDYRRNADVRKVYFFVISEKKKLDGSGF